LDGPFPSMCAIIEIGAADRIRTCDNQLGRMALYQLSYYRNESIYGGPGGA
jgi:hypothetical protein